MKSWRKKSIVFTLWLKLVDKLAGVGRFRFRICFGWYGSFCSGTFEILTCHIVYLKLKPLLCCGSLPPPPSVAAAPIPRPIPSCIIFQEFGYNG